MRFVLEVRKQMARVENRLDERDVSELLIFDHFFLEDYLPPR